MYTEAVILPATGQAIGVDTVNGVQFERMKSGTGAPGSYTDVADGTAMQVAEDGVTSADILHFLEALQNTDVLGKIKINIAGVGTASLDAVSNVPVNMTTGILTSGVLTNLTQFAGIGNEAFINVAESAYNAEISSALSFT